MKPGSDAQYLAKLEPRFRPLLHEAPQVWLEAGKGGLKALLSLPEAHEAKLDIPKT